MKNIEYNYNAPQDILEKITPIIKMSILEIILLLILIFIFYISVFYITPSIIGLKRDIKKQRQKNKQSRMLKKILLQKDIEDEIIKEL